MARVARFLGAAGLVLCLFGLASYVLTRRFDLWTAVHFTGGAILAACGIALDVAGWRRTLGVRGNRARLRAVVGIVLFVAFVMLINVALDGVLARVDLTESRIHTLDDDSRAVLALLDTPVTITAFYRDGDPGAVRAEAELAQIADAAPAVTVRRVDPDREPEIARRLDVRSPGTFVAESSEGSLRIVGSPADAPGTERLARLVLQAAHPAGRVIYVLTGHGEPAIDDLTDPAGLGAWARELGDRAFAVRALLPATTGEVPDDAALVVVPPPITPPSAAERAMLDAWLRRGGRLLVLLDDASDPRTAATVVVERFGPHPITDGFRGRLVLRGTGGLDVLDDSTSGAAIAFAPAEAGGRAVAVASEPGEAGGRLLVVADGDLARNGLLFALDNEPFLARCVSWLVGDDPAEAAQPRRLRASRVDATPARLRNLFRLGVLLIPEAILLIGLGIRGWRRSL